MAEMLVTGFQSPCAEYAEDVISLDQRFLQNPPATFIVRVSQGSGGLDLKKGDYAIVDRSLEPRAGDIVVAVLSNNFVFGKLAKNNNQTILLPYQKVLGEDELNEDFIWGVITVIFRTTR